MYSMNTVFDHHYLTKKCRCLTVKQNYYFGKTSKVNTFAFSIILIQWYLNEWRIGDNLRQSFTENNKQCKNNYKKE